MKKRGMKIGSFVLCLVMLLSMAVVGASAAGETYKDADAYLQNAKKVVNEEKIPAVPGVSTNTTKKIYASAAWDAFEAARTEFDAVSDATKGDDILSVAVQAKYDALVEAQNDLANNKLVNVFQLAQLVGLVEDARNLDFTNCTEAQKAAKLDSLVAAAAVLGLSPTAIIGNGIVFTTDIYNKILGLTEAQARTLISHLQAAVAPCTGGTTTTTTVVDDTTTTTAAPGTTTTTTAPVGAVDKSMLQALYTLNANRIENLYTEASWAKFEKAMEKAAAVLDDPDATQAQVRAAFINLKIAISCLEKAPPCVSTTAAPVCTTAAPVCTTVAPATTCVPVATTCAPVATTCAPVATTCYPVVPTTCVPVVTTTAAPAVVETTCYPVVPTTCVPVVTTTAAPAVVETTCVTVIVTPTVIVTVPVVATTAAPADIDVPDTGVESDMALLLLVASAAIVGVIILKKKVTA